MGSVPQSAAIWAATGGVPASSIVVTCSCGAETWKSKLKSLPLRGHPGNLQPIRCLYAFSFSSSAKMHRNVVLRIEMRDTASKPSAEDEQTAHPASYPGRT